MTTLRDRLATALPETQQYEPPADPVDHADTLIAALGTDAAILEAALAPGAVVTSVEAVARGLAESEGSSASYARAPALWDRLAARVLGVEPTMEP